jgi:pyruvate dehydrogenase E1 component alpha subunit
MSATDLDLLQVMVTIRAFETALAARPDHGFQLLSSGEEAVAAGLCAALGPSDQLLTGGRAIGPALARGVDPDALMAELLGRATGPNQGRAGRGHLAAPGQGFFGAHAVVGGAIGVAAGVALAKQFNGEAGLVAVLFGDGACGAGILHETLNIAALWKLPLLFVCDNNQWSVSTPRTAALAPRQLSDLALAFGMPARTVDGLDVEAVANACGDAAAAIRAGAGPAFLEFETVRLASHSTSARETRSKAELEALRALCPIRRYAGVLRGRGILDDAAEGAMNAAANARAAHALAFAEASPFPTVAEALADVW